MIFPVTATAFRRPGVVPLDQSEVSARSVRRRVGVAWALLYLEHPDLLPRDGRPAHPVPRSARRLAQGALTAGGSGGAEREPRGSVLRPSVFLCLVCLLVVDTVITAASPQVFRHRVPDLPAGRVRGYALWLLTPWWGRRRHAAAAVSASLQRRGSTRLGAGRPAGRPGPRPGRVGSRPGGQARRGDLADGAPPQVAEYAAVAAGTDGRALARPLAGRAGRPGWRDACACMLLLLLSAHQDRAGLAWWRGALVACLKPVHRTAPGCGSPSPSGAAAVSVGIMTVGGVVTTWLARGESARVG